MDRAVQHGRYRRFLAGVATVLGVIAGVGVACIAALAGAPWPILLLAIPLGVRVVSSHSTRLVMVDRIGWVWPIVALPVAVATFVILPPDLAPIALGLDVAAWFTLIVLAGVLEVVLDRDGRFASGTDGA